MRGNNTKLEIQYDRINADAWMKGILVEILAKICKSRILGQKDFTSPLWFMRLYR